MNSRSFAALLLGALASSYLAPQAASQTQNYPATARVEVVSFDFAGDVLYDARIESFVDSKGKDYALEFRKGVVTGIPFGTYRVRVYNLGFEQVERTARVYQPLTTVFIGLPVGDIADYGPFDPGPATLTGRVTDKHNPKSGIVFIKLTALFSDYSTESAIDANEEFEFTAVPSGPALLLVVSQDGVLAARLVKVFGDHSQQRVQIEIPDDPSFSLH
jgi:hypothetical protein